MVAEVGFEPTMEDHIAGQRLWLRHYWRRPLFRWTYGLMLLMLVMAVSTVVWGVIDGESVGDVLADMIVPIVAPLALFGLQWWAWRSVPRQVERMIRQQPNLATTTTWRWDDDGMVATSAAGSSIIRWTELHCWLADGTAIVVMPQERMVLTLPRHAMTLTEAQDLERVLTTFAGPGGRA